MTTPNPAYVAPTAEQVTAAILSECPDARQSQAERAPLVAEAWATVKAAGRMLDGWAESNDDRRKELWRALHGTADDLRAVLEAIDDDHS